MTEYIKDKIVEAGIATFGTDLFISKQPELPDNSICLYDETGTPEPFENAYSYDTHGVQVLVRGSYEYCKKIWDIHRKIVALDSEEFDDDHTIVQVMTQTNPAHVDTDDKGRRIYTAHYDVLVKTSHEQTRIT